jgi:branched-chain amino acid aminotransferase
VSQCENEVGVSAGDGSLEATGKERGMVQELVRAPKLPRGAAPDSAWAFLDGTFVPIREAKISVMTHAFNYGTGIFEGIRAYWNAEQEQLYGLHLREHYSRLLRSGKIMRISIPHSADELVGITVDLLRRCGYREDAYVRPLAYKASPIIGVRLHNLEDGLTVFAVPFGNYIDIDKGIACHVSSWRRVDDNAIPARAKITGSYVNAALAKSEAEEAGFGEAIVLTQDGHVSEGSAANLFLARDGTLITPPATDNILEGIVRASVMRIAADLGIPVEVRSIDRTELYVCDEMFMCGTGVQIAPVTSVDRREVGTGEVGAMTKRLSKAYFAAVRGDDQRYKEWLTPIYPSAR